MTDWRLKGYLLGGCNCDWGCPCNFNARPTKGFCDGGYLWHITEGHFGALRLDGLNFVWQNHSPGPMHEGGLTTGVVIDSRADPAQREAILGLLGGKHGGPWSIFAAITSRMLDPVFAPFDVTIDGLRSRARAGDVFELALGKMVNPVTHAEEDVQLRKPTGLTSLWADLGRSLRIRFSCPGLSYDHSEAYGEFSEFDYSPAGVR